jgi:hypothetical protein
MGMRGREAAHKKRARRGGQAVERFYLLNLCVSPSK